MMLDRLLKLSWKRKLILAAVLPVAPPLVWMQIAVVNGYMFEGGQKFGIVVTSWTALVLGAVLGWKAAK